MEPEKKTSFGILNAIQVFFKNKALLAIQQFFVVLSSRRPLWLSTKRVWSQYCSQTKQNRETAEPEFEPGAAEWDVQKLPLCVSAIISY